MHVSTGEEKIFLAVLFFFALTAGVILLLPRLINKSTSFQPKSILWGIGIGLPNFLSVYFFFKTLESGILESSQVYPIFNMGVIVTSTIGGILLFKEKISFYIEIIPKVIIIKSDLTPEVNTKCFFFQIERQRFVTYRLTRKDSTETKMKGLLLPLLRLKLHAELHIKT